MRKLHQVEVSAYTNRFLACQNMEDLHKMGFNIKQIKSLALNPPYHSFDIKKSNGKIRHIEAPEPQLKGILRQFNFYLQCIYFVHQTVASHGYIIRTRNQSTWKNILQNAQSHLGAKYMMNIDFKDFFHQFSKKKIWHLLQTTPFQFDKTSALILAKLFTYKGRLPMGAPTSPSLSNLGTIQLDLDLTKWALEQNLVYTRFVDDMTFSSKKWPLTRILHNQIVTICEANHLNINPKKTKFYGEFDIKTVTGLIINKTIDIAPEFYQELNQDIKRLRSVAEVGFLVKNSNQNEMVKKFKQEVDGKVNFIGMIEGYNSPIFYKYLQKVKKAHSPDVDALSSRWTNSNYF